MTAPGTACARCGDRRDAHLPHLDLPCVVHRDGVRCRCPAYLAPTPTAEMTEEES